MMSMNIAICDDDKPFRRDLSVTLVKYSHEQHVDIYITEFSSGGELLKCEKQFDIVFMDFRMDGLNGIATVERMRERDDNTTVIFLSSYGEMVFDTFAVDTFRFLVKPVVEKKLFCALDDYIETVNSDNFLLLKTHEKDCKIRYSDIIYAEATNKRSIVRTSKDTLEFSKGLCEIERMLPKDEFIRTHRAFVVGYRHIVSHNRREIHFDNGEMSIIGKTYYKRFKNGFLDYIKGCNMRNLRNE